MNNVQPNQAQLDVGDAMHGLMAELYPICRSITGDGARATLRAIGERVPLQSHEVASGTAVFDWTVPPEWNIRDAYIKNRQGERVVDFQQSSLHVMSYSSPVHTTLTLDELKPHLFSLPAQPDLIPYRTSYYSPHWGFCLAHHQLLALPDDVYDVCIDASLEPGHLSYGEYVIPGSTSDEVLISCHICHPALANDNLSGIAVATALAQHLATQANHYTYRFLFIPATIGAITWLAQNQAHVGRIKHGMVLTCVGDPGHTTYKQSRRGDALIDRAWAQVLKDSGEPYAIEPFVPYGYDERQYCSPGFNLPVGCVMRTPHGRFPEYHTSADNLDFVQPTYLLDTLQKCLAVVDVLEHDRCYLNQNPFCEPQLGKRGLYTAIGGYADVQTLQLALLWVLNFSDGTHSLLDIVERSGLVWAVIKQAAHTLVAHGLLIEQ